MSTDLQDKCNYIAQTLSNPDVWHKEYVDGHGEGIGDDLKAGAWEWLEDQLEYRYEITSDGTFMHGKVLCAFGGPNIWADFSTNTVIGYWGGEKAEAGFHDSMHVNSYLEDMYDITIGEQLASQRD